jgi:hypothetical protein
MRRIAVVVTFAAACLLGRAALAQQQNPISYDAVAKAKAGQWAEYTMSMKGAPQTIKMRYALVEKTDKSMALEVDSQTPMGPVLMHMQFSAAPDAWKLDKARVQANGQTKDIGAAELQNGAIKRNDPPGKQIGAEATITVPAGKFAAKHYQKQVEMPGMGMQTIDVYMSDKALPTGLVKMTAQTGIEAVLSATGGDAKAQLPITGAAESATPAATPAPSGNKSAPKK